MDDSGLESSALHRWMEGIPTKVSQVAYDYVPRALVFIALLWLFLFLMDRLGATSDTARLTRRVVAVASGDSRKVQHRSVWAAAVSVLIMAVAAVASQRYGWSDMAIETTLVVALGMLTIAAAFFLRNAPAVRLDRRVVQLKYDGNGEWSFHVRRSGAWGLIWRRMPHNANGYFTIVAAIKHMDEGLRAAGIRCIRATTPDMPSGEPRQGTAVRPGMDALGEYHERVGRIYAKRLPGWNVRVAEPETWGMGRSLLVSVTRLTWPKRLTLRGFILERTSGCRSESDPIP